MPTPSLPVPARRRTTSSAWAAAVGDLCAVVAFAAIGRASHESGAFGIGLITTAWPFVAALAFGWIVTRAWRQPLEVMRTGVPLWLITVGVGLLLRVAAGATAQVPFIIVATIVLAIVLVGWRGIAALIRRRRG